MRISNFFRFLNLFFLLALPLGAKITFADNSGVLSEFEDQLRYETYRIKHSKTDELMDVLNIQQGMTLLDIGTGTGQYAYRFAEELKGTGKIFATDINADLINYVSKEAERRGFNNIYPVLVRKDGVDNFYAENKYDLITIFHLFSKIPDPVNYFKQIKNYLNKNGRLVVLGYKFFNYFTLEDATDFDGLIKELILLPITDPFYKGLRESTRTLLKRELNEASRELLMSAIIADFNQICANHSFKFDFLKDERTFKEDVIFVSENEKHFFTMFLLPHYNEIDKKVARRINKFLIVQRFREYLFHGDEMLTDKANDQNRNLLWVKRNLEEAGYELESQHHFNPYRFVLVFSVDKDVRTP